MTDIKRAFLHILDAENGNLMISENEIDVSVPEIKRYLKSLTGKISDNVSGRKSKTGEDSPLKKIMEESSSEERFVRASGELASLYYDYLIQSEKPGIMDLISIEYSSEGRNFEAHLFMRLKPGFCHMRLNRNSETFNSISLKYDILPAISKRPESYVLFETDTEDVYFTEKINVVNGREVFILPELILKCEDAPSGKEIIEKVREITEEVASENMLDSVELINKTKMMVRNMYENPGVREERDNDKDEYTEEAGPAEVSDDASDVSQDEKEISADSIREYNIETLFQGIFEGKEEILDKAMEKLSENNLSGSEKVNLKSMKRQSSVQKIVTDTGITIAFPSEILGDTSLLEIRPDGHGGKEIVIKNIGSLKNS